LQGFDGARIVHCRFYTFGQGNSISRGWCLPGLGSRLRAMRSSRLRGGWSQPL